MAIKFSLFVLRTNSELCHLQHKLIGLYNRDEKCLQRGTDWVFKYSGMRFFFKFPQNSFENFVEECSTERIEKNLGLVIGVPYCTVLWLAQQHWICTCKKCRSLRGRYTEKKTLRNLMLSSIELVSALTFIITDFHFDSACH